MADAVRTVEIKVEESGADKTTKSLEGITKSLAALAGGIEAAKIAQQVFNDVLESSTFLLDEVEAATGLLSGSYAQLVADIGDVATATAENTNIFQTYLDVVTTSVAVFANSVVPGLGSYIDSLVESGEANAEAVRQIRFLTRQIEVQEPQLARRQLQIRQAITLTRDQTASEAERAQGIEQLGQLLAMQETQIESINEKRRQALVLAIENEPREEQRRQLSIQLLNLQVQEAQQLQSLEFFRRAYNMALNKQGAATKGDDSTAGALMQVNEEMEIAIDNFVVLNGELFVVSDETQRLGQKANALADEWINQNLVIEEQIPLLEQQNQQLQRQVELKSVLSGLGTIASFIPGLGQVSGALRIGQTALSLFGRGGAFGAGGALESLLGGGSGGFGGAVGSGPLLPGAATQTANVLVTEDLTRVTSRVNITENRATL